MSVVVWDGRSLAADMAGFNGGLKFYSPKIVRVAMNLVLGWVGSEYTGRLMIEWFVNGHHPKDFPEQNKGGEDWSRLIVARREDNRNEVVTYECSHAPLPVDAPYMAWGSAKEVAMGALAAGVDARRAVEIAIQHHRDCGFGVQVETL